MKRSEPLKRLTPLTAKSPLRRNAWLREVSPKRAASAGNAAKPNRPQPAVSAATRKALAARSGGWCEMALPGCAGRAADPAHRNGRGMGGRKGAAKELHDRLSNVLHACRRCHETTHWAPAWACRLGLMLRTGQDPAAVPVLYRGVWVLLADDGAVVAVEAMTW